MIHISWSGEARNKIGSLAPLHMSVGIGFGSAVILHDGEVLLEGEPHDGMQIARGQENEERPKYVKCARDRIRERSHRVGRGWLTLERVERYLLQRARSGATLLGKIECSINGPFWSAVWIRRAPNEWECTKTGNGFA